MSLYMILLFSQVCHFVDMFFFLSKFCSVLWVFSWVVKERERKRTTYLCQLGINSLIFNILPWYFSVSVAYQDKPLMIRDVYLPVYDILFLNINHTTERRIKGCQFFVLGYRFFGIVTLLLLWIVFDIPFLKNFLLSFKVILSRSGK